MPFTNAPIIPDIAFYEDDPTTAKTVDFQKMKAAGAVGVIVRAGQGIYVDRMFREFWRLAKAAGLLRGCYWFYDSRNDPIAQATTFLFTVADDRPELMYWLDLEENYGGKWQGWRNWKTCLNQLKNARPNDVGIYTAPAYWIEHRPISTIELGYFADFPLWQAQYKVSVPEPLSPWMNYGLVFWQFTDHGDGDKYGVESKEIDLSYFNGTLQQFNNKFGGVQPPPPTGEEVTTVQYKVIWNSGATKREAPTTSATAHGYYTFDAPDNIVNVVEEDIADLYSPTDPGKRWVKTDEGYFVARIYPDGTGIAKTRLEKVTNDPAPEPAPEKRVVKATLFYDDGTTEDLFPSG